MNLESAALGEDPPPVAVVGSLGLVGRGALAPPGVLSDRSPDPPGDAVASRGPRAWNHGK